MGLTDAFIIMCRSIAKGGLGLHRISDIIQVFSPVESSPQIQRADLFVGPVSEAKLLL